MLASTPLLFLPFSALTHSPVCLFSPCSASSSASLLSLAELMLSRERGLLLGCCTAWRWMGAVTCRTCYLGTLWREQTWPQLLQTARGALGQQCSLCCCDPRRACGYLPAPASQHFSTPVQNPYSKWHRKDFLFSEEKTKRSSLLDAAAVGIEHKPLSLVHVITPGSDPARNPQAFT